MCQMKWIIEVGRGGEAEPLCLTFKKVRPSPELLIFTQLNPDFKTSKCQWNNHF